MCGIQKIRLTWHDISKQSNFQVRIAEGEHPQDIKESDYFTERGEFNVYLVFSQTSSKDKPSWFILFQLSNIQGSSGWTAREAPPSSTASCTSSPTTGWNSKTTCFLTCCQNMSKFSNCIPIIQIWWAEDGLPQPCRLRQDKKCGDRSQGRRGLGWLQYRG